MKNLLITIALCFTGLALAAQNGKAEDTAPGIRRSLSMQWGLPVWGTGSDFKSLMNKYDFDDYTPAGWFGSGHRNPGYLPFLNVSLQYEQYTSATRAAGLRLALTNSGIARGYNKEQGNIEFVFFDIVMSAHYKWYFKNGYLSAGPAVHVVRIDPSAAKPFVRLKPGLMCAGGVPIIKSARSIFNIEAQFYLTPGMKLGPYSRGYYQWNDNGEMTWVTNQIIPRSTVALSHISLGVVYGRKW